MLSFSVNNLAVFELQSIVSYGNTVGCLFANNQILSTTTAVKFVLLSKFGIYEEGFMHPGKRYFLS